MSKLADDFERFHAANPDVWVLFERLTFDLIRAGKRRYSADAVLHRIRWHYDVETTTVSPKLNNNLTPYYARKWRQTHPAYADMFVTRKLAEEPTCG